MENKNISFYRFIDCKNNEIGITQTNDPLSLMRSFIQDGVSIGGFNLMNSNKAICEITKRKNNPLPMDFINIK